MKYLPLVFASLFHRRSRTLLTLLSIVTAFVLFGFLDGVRVVFSQGADTAGVDRLIVTSRLSIIQPLPLAHQVRIAQIPGVAAIAHANWFGGIYQDRKNFFPNIAVSPEPFLAIHPEISLTAAERERFLKERTAALVGSELAARFGWKVGDRIPLEATIWPHKSGTNTWTFEIAGIMRAPPDTRSEFSGEMLFRYDYFDEGRVSAQGTAGWYIVRIADPARSSEIAQAIDRLFDNSDGETKSQSEKDFNLAFAKQFGDIGLIVSAIMAAVFFTLLLLTGHTMAQSVRDRVPELAVLKTLGFTNLGVSALVVGEAVLLVGLGGLVGLGAAAIGLPLISGNLGGQLPKLAVVPESWLLGVALMLALGLLVGLPPAWRALRLRIVDALAGR